MLAGGSGNREEGCWTSEGERLGGVGGYSQGDSKETERGGGAKEEGGGKGKGWVVFSTPITVGFLLFALPHILPLFNSQCNWKNA